MTFSEEKAVGRTIDVVLKVKGEKSFKAVRSKYIDCEVSDCEYHGKTSTKLVSYFRWGRLTKTS